MRRLIVILILSATFSVVALSELLAARQVSAFEQHARPNRFSAEWVYRYVEFRQLAPWLSSDAIALANAFNLARQESTDSVTKLANGGRALKHLVKLADSPEFTKNRWKAQAAYEALVLLSAMPWDSQIRSLASRMAVTLSDEASQNNSALEADEKVLIARLLKLYEIRAEKSAFESTQPLVTETERQVWSRALAQVRVVLAQCMHPTLEKNVEYGWELLKGGFGTGWLKVEAYGGWDDARAESVLLTSSNPQCQKFAARFKSMVNFNF